MLGVSNREYPLRYRKAARTFYYISVIAFAVSISLYFPENLRGKKWLLLIIDFISSVFIYTSIALYLKKLIPFRYASFIYTYSALLNCIFSSWYYCSLGQNTTGYLLVNTIFYCVNLVVGGFCVGYKHSVIAALMYAVSFGTLMFNYGDSFVKSSDITIIFLVFALAWGVSWFLFLLEKSMQQELALKEEIIAKNHELAKQQEKILKAELAGKQNEIMTKTMFLLESVEKNNSFIHKLAPLRNAIPNDSRQLLDGIIHDHRLEHNEKYWKEFETSFMDIHHEFFTTIYEKHPLLSTAELRLSALVYLGLSSKQIADVLSITPQSVDVARSRLRSKMNLPVHANLRNHISTLLS